MRTRRLLAALTDWLISLMGLALGLGDTFLNEPLLSKEGRWAVAGMAWAVVTLWQILSMASGQSIGKRLLGLRVVRLDGQPASLLELEGAGFSGVEPA